jgi:hypothetical protein
LILNGVVEHPERGWNGIAQDGDDRSDLESGDVSLNGSLVNFVLIVSLYKCRSQFVAARLEVVMKRLDNVLPRLDALPCQYVGKKV